MDELVGGGGIDFLVLDVNPSYSALGGESFDGHGDGTPEDNATDVLLINGTTGDDVIRIGGTADGRLSVSYNGVARSKPIGPMPPARSLSRSVSRD